MKWVRAKDGAIFGVCKGLAKTLDLPVGIVRLCWLLSVLFLCVGAGIYILLAITLPREDKIVEAQEPWILGVCTKIAQRTEIEVGAVRFLAMAMAIMSGGGVLLAYLILYFVLDDKKIQSSDAKPATPPSTTEMLV
jgi:phage shock protein PspC (stress-responsive transcriptional regulator)